MSYDVVIPTLGRPSLDDLLHRLATATGRSAPGHVFVIDDRPDVCGAAIAIPPGLANRTSVLRGGGCGPAHARNAGWQASHAEWIAFVDDDVVLSEAWTAEIAADIASLGNDASLAGTFANIVVPLPRDRRPTDWERNVSRLETAQFITADAAFRRTALEAVGGFDERFPRAYREDVDLAFRLRSAGFRFARGARTTIHPVRPASRWISVILQRGNADDALMTALHGEAWHAQVIHEQAVFRRHVLAVTAALEASRALVDGRFRTAASHAARWSVSTALFALSRILPGPRTPNEITTMLLTSIVIPFAAVRHRAAGEVRISSPPFTNAA